MQMKTKIGIVTSLARLGAVESKPVFAGALRYDISGRTLAESHFWARENRATFRFKAFVWGLAVWMVGVNSGYCQVTNYVVVVQDDVAECVAAFHGGLVIGGTIAAGLFVMWMISLIPRDAPE